MGCDTAQVLWTDTDVCEEHPTFIFRVEMCRVKNWFGLYKQDARNVVTQTNEGGQKNGGVEKGTF